jgi:hypothetical protein
MAAPRSRPQGNECNWDITTTTTQFPSTIKIDSSQAAQMSVFIRLFFPTRGTNRQVDAHGETMGRNVHQPDQPAIAA